MVKDVSVVPKTAHLSFAFGKKDCGFFPNKITAALSKFPSEVRFNFLEIVGLAS